MPTDIPWTTPPKVVILTANTGGGHRSAARSLAEALDGLARVSFLDLIDDYAPFPWNTMSATYAPWVNHAPWLWHLMYRIGASRRRVTFAESATYPFIKHRLAPPLIAACPDLVVSVHPLQIDLPLRILRAADNRAPFVTVVTDPVSPPVAWFCPDVDLCIVATEPARTLAIGTGMNPSRVKIIGLPIGRAFSEIRGQSKPDARIRLGLRADLPLILLTGGGAGVGKLLPMARTIAARLAGQSASAQMAIIAGYNQVLLRRLRVEPWPVPVTVLGFVEDMAHWLAATDLLITKAGPATLAEAACAGVPVVITSFVPGQETGNVAWAEQHKAGVFAPDIAQVADLVSDWFRPGNASLADMATQARAMAQPEAATRIVETALELLRRRFAL